MGLDHVKRRLLPTFKFMQKTLAWRCDLCDKGFFVCDEEADSEIVPPHITKEFQAHSCSVTLAVTRSRHKDDNRGTVVSIESDLRFRDGDRERD